MTTQDSPAPSSASAVSAVDSRALIKEAFAMEGIVEADCRSIFFDWALGLPSDVDQHAAIETLLGHYEPIEPDHPMIAVLKEGVGRREGGPDVSAASGRRRGGRRRNHPGDAG